MLCSSIELQESSNQKLLKRLKETNSQNDPIAIIDLTELDSSDEDESITFMTKRTKFALLSELEDLEASSDIVTNVEEFDCAICLTPQAPGDGLVLRECLHQFCKNCICQHAKHSNDFDVKCPYVDDSNNKCDLSIVHRDLKGIMTEEEFDKFLAKSIQFSESAITNTIHCKTINCNGFSIVETGDVDFICEVCYVVNCIPCKAIHNGLTCEEHKAIEGNNSNKLFTQLLVQKKAMLCPKCGVVIQKIDGCDSIQCLMCKVFICWATRGLRWGPKGPGDTSGGCKCMPQKRCHPSCTNCH